MFSPHPWNGSMRSSLIFVSMATILRKQWLYYPQERWTVFPSLYSLIHIFLVCTFEKEKKKILKKKKFNKLLLWIFWFPYYKIIFELQALIRSNIQTQFFQNPQLKSPKLWILIGKCTSTNEKYTKGVFRHGTIIRTGITCKKILL